MHRLRGPWLAWLWLAGIGVAQTPTTTEVTTPPAERPRPRDATALFATMAAMTGLEATFREEKHVALLALPLQSKGRLFFFRRDAKVAGSKPEGYLARIVDAPEPSKVTITPRELRLQNRDGTEVIDLSRSDKVRSFITSLVHVFAGDETALRNTYAVDYTPDADDTAVWTLTLVPRVEPLDKMLKHLRLVGRGETVERIEIVEPNGDRTVTEVLTANPARRFDRNEQKQLFGIDAP
jgi:hypothetical protein